MTMEFKDIEYAALKNVAELMYLAARTAPKASGKDFLEIKLLEKDEIESLYQGMIKYGKETGQKRFERDAINVSNSRIIVLIGLKDAAPSGLNCGACGFDKCEELKPDKVIEFKGPQCAIRLLDLGIAIGSAVKIAGMLNVDNRIMYRIGAVARRIGLTEADIVMGIPLSCSGKNIYFDRFEDYKHWQGFSS